MDCSPPGSPAHVSLGRNAGVGCHFLLQRIFPIRDQTRVSCIASRFFTLWTTMEAPHLNLAQHCKAIIYQFKRKFTSGTYSPLESWGKSQLSDPQSAMPSNGENPTPEHGSHEDQSRQGPWGSNAQHNTDTERSPATAVKRNDKGALWFLHRVKISNLHILDITLKRLVETTLKWGSPSLLTSTWNCEYGLEPAVWVMQCDMVNESPIWNQALFFASALVSPSVK